MLWRMKLTKPKDAVRVIFFRGQHFDSSYYSHYYGFDHFLMYLNYLAFVHYLDGVVGYYLVFSKLKSSKI